jgi:hypothetical protein
MRSCCSDPSTVITPVPASNEIPANRHFGSSFSNPRQVFRFRAVTLDVVFEPAGSRRYEDLIRDADTLRLQIEPEVRAPVASLRDLIRTKEAAGREKDRAALPMLRRTLEEQGN